MNLSPLNLLLAIFILGFLIAFHEMGHMLVAKWTGMRVLRFSVGFGPVLWKRTWGGTIYQLALVPVGGFVEIDGMNPAEEHEDGEDPRLYENKPVWARLAVLLAGPGMNYLFAFAVAGAAYAACGTAYVNHQTNRSYPLRLEEVVKGKAADEAGLKRGDVVTHVDGFPVQHIADYREIIHRQRAGFRYVADPEARAALRRLRLSVLRNGEKVTVVQPIVAEGEVLTFLQLVTAPGGAGVRVARVAPAARKKSPLRAMDLVVAIGDRPIRRADDLLYQAAMARDGFRWAGPDRWKVTLSVQRGKARFTREVKPDEQTGEIGVRFETTILWVRQGVWTDFKHGLAFPVAKSREVLGQLSKLVQFDEKVASSAKGPVGIVEEVQKRLDAGPDQAVLIAVIVSVLLGLFNLLPLPALDGGRIVFRLVELVARVRVRPEREARIHFYGMMVLLILVLLLTVRDVRGCLGI